VAALEAVAVVAVVVVLEAGAVVEQYLCFYVVLVQFHEDTVLDPFLCCQCCLLKKKNYKKTGHLATLTHCFNPASRQLNFLFFKNATTKKHQMTNW
jgi:hypothetical protein